MDKDATWYGSRPLPRPHCVRRGPSSPIEGGREAPSFRPMSIVATVAHLSYCWALLLYVSTFVPVTKKRKMSLWHCPHIYSVARAKSTAGLGGHIATSGCRSLSQSFGATSYIIGLITKVNKSNVSWISIIRKNLTINSCGWVTPHLTSYELEVQSATRRIHACADYDIKCRCFLGRYSN